jgi:hypothetical protein
MSDMTGGQLARYAWGVFIGGVIGFIVGKVYLIWAILFQQYGRTMDPYFGAVRTETIHYGTASNMASTPLYISAPAHNITFMTMMVFLFAGLGLLFVLTFVPLRRHASEPAGDASVQNLH